ncbi:MAG TPA: class I SAM-dependent methyltransferase [Thermoanaerobaculia bacterium]
MAIDPGSVLLVTLDSCRYDTFASADVPALRQVGPLHKAQAPSYFTFGSHAAMFAGFTPGIANVAAPLLNPKFGKIFKLSGAAFPGKGGEGFTLEGRNIIEGFKRLGYFTMGSGAVQWFDPGTPAAQILISEFDEFFYPGNSWSLARQLAWIEEQLARHPQKPVFLFLNIGETHVPYYYEGASWSSDDSPCVPFQTVDRSADCRLRQRACLEFVDKALEPLLERFSGSTIILCGDHGDCWGEDGLWEHGISHPMTLTVPLLIRLRGAGIAGPERSNTVRSGAYDAVPEGSIEEFLSRTEGMTSFEEAKLLYELAREVRSGCIVEVGAYRGRTAVALGRGSLDGHRVPVFTIEPHATFTGVLGGRFGPADAGAFHKAMLETGCYHVVRLVNLSSEQVVQGWHLPVRLLWIDGDHRYEGVRCDFESWRPHLIQGATVVFDDASDPLIGPHRLITELLAAGEAEKIRDFGKIAVLRVL